MKYEFLDNNIKHEFDAKGYYSVNSGMVFYRQFIDVAFVTEDSIEVCSKSKFLGLIKNKINKSISKNYIIFNYKDIVNDKFITIKILISSANFDKGHQLVEYIKQKLSFEKYKGKEPKNITPEVFYNKLNLRNYVVLDLETTGLSPEKDKVTEFCLIKFKDGKIGGCV